MSEPFFEGFALSEIEAGGVRFRLRQGGEGPPLLLLHGHPRTHATWWRVAPLLAKRFRIVCPDLPGFGRSRFHEGADLAEVSTKRAKAAALAALMQALGHERFFLAGHDRGSYTAFRLAMDRPDLVERLTLIDCVPILEALERCDARFAEAWWHWFFFAAPGRKAERTINADPDAWYAPDAARMGAASHADLRQAIHDESVVKTMVWDYRVSLDRDRADDEADRRAGRTLACPTLCLWSSRDDMEALYGDVLSVWRPWAPDLRGGPIDSGHHVAEDAPEDLASALGGFFADLSPGSGSPAG